THPHFFPPPPTSSFKGLKTDVDELLDMESYDSQAARVRELLVDCYKPAEAFISDLLDKIRAMQKLSTPQKK
uniref:Protein phosphatase 1 regulatory subunit 14 n=1 Tax=Mus spicilegus TaxID=10103 RepID=A0A8C6GDU9_MUSSI